jgi:hypothetical protein
VPLDSPDARDTARPCRPTISCTADFAPPGALEVEAGALTSQPSRPGARVVSFPFQLKLTLSPLLQLQIGSNGYTVAQGRPSVRDLDNVIIGPKLHLSDQGSVLPSFAVSVEVGLPTFPASGTARHDDLFVTAYASKDLGWLHVDWNAGPQVWALDGATIAQGFTALALSPILPPPVGVAIEGYVYSDAAPIAPHDGGVRGVVTVTARPWLVFDAGADAGFYPSTRAVSLFLGATVIPVVFWRPDAAKSS